VARLDTAVKSLARAIGKKNWEEAEEKLPLVEDLLEELEECSGIRLLGARARLERIRKEIKRYDWVSAWADAEAIMSEIIYDIGCRQFKIK